MDLLCDAGGQPFKLPVVRPLPPRPVAAIPRSPHDHGRIIAPQPVQLIAHRPRVIRREQRIFRVQHRGVGSPVAERGHHRSVRVPAFRQNHLVVRVLPVKDAAAVIALHHAPAEIHPALLQGRVAFLVGPFHRLHVKIVVFLGKHAGIPVFVVVHHGVMVVGGAEENAILIQPVLTGHHPLDLIAGPLLKLQVIRVEYINLGSVHFQQNGSGEDVVVHPLGRLSAALISGAVTDQIKLPVRRQAVTA